MREHPQLRDLGLQRGQLGQGVVAAGVVDEDDLAGAAGERAGDLARERRSGAAFVETGTTTEKSGAFDEVAARAMAPE